jgi:hypothetical protein
LLVFPSSSVVSHASFLLLMGSTIFLSLVVFFSFGGCSGLEDCALTVFSVVLSWLGGFFYGGFAVFSDVLWWLGSFFDVLWWLGGFSVVLSCFFLLLMALALPPLVFSAILEVTRD